MNLTAGTRILVDEVPATVRTAPSPTGQLGIVYDHASFATHIYLDEATVEPYDKTVRELDDEKVQARLEALDLNIKI